MSQSQAPAPSQAAIRRAGAVVALAAASALIAMGFPAAEAPAYVVLALYAILLLGCAAVLLSPAHGAVADLARRAKEAARGTVLTAARAPAGLLRWLGFAGIALYVSGDVAARNEASVEVEVEAASLEPVKDFILFLMLLAGVWAIYLSMIRETGGQPPRPPATAADEASLDSAGVWPTVTIDTAKGAPPPRPPVVAAEEDPDGGEVAVAPACVIVVDSKL